MIVFATSLSQFLEKILNRFGFVKTQSHPQEPSPIQYCRWRLISREILDVCPPSLENAVQGILVKIGFPEGVVTLLAMDDGTLSLFFSGGGGIVGLGRLAGPALAARELLRMAPTIRGHFSVCSGPLVPPSGGVHFYIFSDGYTQAAQASLAEVQKPRHPLSAYFLEICRTLDAIRKEDESRGWNGSQGNSAALTCGKPPGEGTL